MIEFKEFYFVILDVRNCIFDTDHHFSYVVEVNCKIIYQVCDNKQFFICSFELLYGNTGLRSVFRKRFCNYTQDWYYMLDAKQCVYMKTLLMLINNNLGECYFYLVVFHI